MQFRCNSKANDLEPIKGDYLILVDGWEVPPIVTLKEAASKQLPWNTFAANKYNSKPGTCESHRRRMQKKMELCVAAIVTKGTTARTSNRLESWCFFFCM